MQNDTTQAQPLPMTGTTDTRIGRLELPSAAIHPMKPSRRCSKRWISSERRRPTSGRCRSAPPEWQQQHETVFGEKDGDLVI